jgi:hypothetical protein
MKAATLGLVAIAVVLAGCTQKSEIDKCMDDWEKSVNDTPEDKDKARRRLQMRGWCMRQMAPKQNL